jgi:hypothetical protein
MDRLGSRLRTFHVRGRSGQPLQTAPGSQGCHTGSDPSHTGPVGLDDGPGVYPPEPGCDAAPAPVRSGVLFGAASGFGRWEFFVACGTALLLRCGAAGVSARGVRASTGDSCDAVGPGVSGATTDGTFDVGGGVETIF